MRLVTGLKRYLHTKHGEGLLSAASVQARRPRQTGRPWRGAVPRLPCNQTVGRLLVLCAHTSYFEMLCTREFLS